MQTVLRTVGLTKRFGRKTAVDNVSMTINKGDIYGFIGRNGAGKTTLMRMVLSLAFPTSGEIELFGQQSGSQGSRRIGSLIEAPGLYKGCSAEENLKRFSLLYGTDASEIPEILSAVGLSSAGRKKAGKFSLGMQQRLGIAIALLGNPEFVVLDEPMNGLDPEGMVEIRNLIIGLNRDHGTTFLISSHMLDELSKTVTRYGIINDGLLIEEVTAQELEIRCRHKLSFTVNDPAAAAEIIAQKVPREDIQTTPTGVLVSSHLDESGSLNQRLNFAGIIVSELSLVSDGLEKYFIERTGE